MRIKKPLLRTIALVVIAVSVLVCLAAFAEDRPAAPQREPRVNVTFLSRPDDADLYIDGKYVGSTDLGYRVTPGVHVIEMKLDDHETWRRELTVTPENPTRVSAILKKQK